MEFKVEDVRIDISSLGQFGTGQKIRMTHIPTGIVVEEEATDTLLASKAKKALLKQLEQKLEQRVKHPETFAQIVDQYKVRSMSRMYRLAKVAIKEEAITSWFSTSHEMLGGQTPFEACFTDEGYDHVENILAGVVYGFPA